MTYKELCKKSFAKAVLAVFFIENETFSAAWRDFRYAVSDLFFEFVYWAMSLLYLLLFPVTSLIVFKLHSDSIKARKKKAKEVKKKKIGRLFRNISPYKKDNTLRPDRF